MSNADPSRIVPRVVHRGLPSTDKLDRMPTVHLVRHGEVANPNHVVYADLPGFNLSPLGVRQAHSAGRHLAEQRVERVISSPLARARQTATAIGRHHDLDPIVDDALIETRQYPNWTGLRWDDLETQYPEQLEGYLADATTLTDAMESIATIAMRVVDAIDRHLADGIVHLVVVGHQDPIQAARLSLVGRPLSELLHDPPGHASIVTLQLRSSIWIETAWWTPLVPD